MSALAPWWAARSLREKRLLLVMAALLVVAVSWLGILRPLSDALTDAHRRQIDAVILLGDTEARVAEVRRLRAGAPAPLAAPLDATIRDRANQAGFALGEVTALAPDRVRIAIAQARPGALLGWVAALEDAGMLVETLEATDNGDRTVSARITLRSRRA